MTPEGTPMTNPAEIRARVRDSCAAITEAAVRLTQAASQYAPALGPWRRPDDSPVLIPPASLPAEHLQEV